MGTIKQKAHVTGIVIIRAEGSLIADDIDDWRGELVDFIKSNEKGGACGALVDVSEVKDFSIEALDAVLEFLADPEEVISGVRMRFALIGVKPFTQRFLREAMPLEEVKHIRARFFHEIAEEEALAWLQAMVNSATDLPEVKPSAKHEPGDDGKKVGVDTKPGILKSRELAESKSVTEATGKKSADAKQNEKDVVEKKSTSASSNSKIEAKK